MDNVTREEQREIDQIVSTVVANFRAELAKIMAAKGLPKEGDLTTEQQCEMMADLMGWHRRAVDAEAALATALAEREADRAEIARLREGLNLAANRLDLWHVSAIAGVNEALRCKLAGWCEEARATLSGSTQ